MAEILTDVIETLRGHGIAVPANCDEATALTLIREALAPPLSARWRHVQACLHKLTEAVQLGDKVRGAYLEACERELAAALVDAAPGQVTFSGIFRLRPHGEELVDFARRAVDRLAHEPPVGVTRSIFGARFPISD